MVLAIAALKGIGEKNPAFSGPKLFEAPSFFKPTLTKDR
jgi:hypothetical protein